MSGHEHIPSDDSQTEARARRKDVEAAQAQGIGQEAIIQYRTMHMGDLKFIFPGAESLETDSRQHNTEVTENDNAA